MSTLVLIDERGNPLDEERLRMAYLTDQITIDEFERALAQVLNGQEPTIDIADQRCRVAWQTVNEQRAAEAI